MTGDLDHAGLGGHGTSMLIYKILRAAELQAFQDAGETLGAPIDLADGYIHFSTATQAAETAAKHFADADGLSLLAFESDSFGEALVWEPSRGGAIFPHLYGTLKLDEIVWSQPLPLGPEGHQFPAEMV